MGRGGLKSEEVKLLVVKLEAKKSVYQIGQGRKLVWTLLRINSYCLEGLRKTTRADSRLRIKNLGPTLSRNPNHTP